MEKWNGHVAVVTGASTGIGEAISIKLVEHGVKVVGLARRQQLLDALAEKLSSEKGKFYPFVADVRKEDDILKAFQWTKENVGPVSIMINNAGVLIMGNVSEASADGWRDTLDINVLAPCIANKEAIKHMKENGIAGHIINMNSIAGQRTNIITKSNLYGPSKFAITSYTEELRMELAKTQSKIRVTSISPGCVSSDMSTNTMNYLGVPLSKVKMLQSKDIADSVIFALSAPESVNISEITIQPVDEMF